MRDHLKNPEGYLSRSVPSLVIMVVSGSMEVYIGLLSSRSQGISGGVCKLVWTVIEKVKNHCIKFK